MVWVVLALDQGVMEDEQQTLPLVIQEVKDDVY